MTNTKYAEHLPVFMKVARSGSFSSTAAQLGIAPSSVVRQIDTLENALGTRLFIRSTHGLVLTDAGELLMNRVPAMIDTLVDLHAEIMALGDEPRGTLRIACLPTFARHHVLPLLPPLLSKYPELRVALNFTERMGNPLQERLDAIIHIGSLTESRLYAQFLGTQRWSICASPVYLREHGHPDSPARLVGHRLLDKGHDPDGLGWGGLRASGTIPEDATDNALACNDFETLLSAAVAGLGLCYLPTWITEKAIAEGQLVTVFEDPAGREEAIHLLRPLPRSPAKLAVFTHALFATTSALREPPRPVSPG